MPRRNIGVTSAETRIKKYRGGSYYARGWKRWVDPYPEIQGTVIEKMIYTRLVQMGVRFIFQGDFTVNIPEIELFKIYRPDFILPDAKIIIDPFGSFWHSSAQAIEADSYKFALFETMGYKVVVWWDYEIESLGLDALIARVPELNNYAHARVDHIGNLPQNVSAVDDLKGLRTLNQKFKYKGYKHSAKVGKKRIRKAKYSYATR